MSDHLRDLVASALRGDDQWDSLTESQKAVWRADADRAIKAMRDAPGYAQGQPEAWRFRYEQKEGVWGKWTVQKNKPTWYQPDQSDVEIEPLYAALPAPAGVEVTVEELARFLSPEPDRCVFGSGGISTDANGKTTSSFSCSRYAWEDQIALAGRLKSRFTILAKPAQEGQGS